MEIYFIDDDLFINRYHEIVFGKVASDNGFELKFFKNGEEAINQLCQIKPEEFPKAIFLDINMPIMNGWEFLEAYEQHGLSNTEIVILTTSKNPAYEKKANECVHVKSYKIKPLEKDYFKSILNESKV